MGINMFNRREIAVTRDISEMNRVTGCLTSSSIRYITRTNSMTNPGRSHGIPNIQAGAAYETRIYVHKNDYEKAIHVIRK